MKTNETLSFWSLILNLFLFLGKLFAGLISNSVVLISDALDALGDVLASIGIIVAIKTGNKPADEDHPFGHHRAESLAGFVVAMFTGILGFQVIALGFRRLFRPEPTNITFLILCIVLVSMLVKLGMYIVFHKKGNQIKSPAILASAIDSRNDVFRSAIVLIAVISTIIGLLWIESVVAIALGFFLFYSAYDLGKKNIDMLMGKAPSKRFVDHIKKEAKKFPGIKGVGRLKAHYAGNSIQLEIVVMMSPNMTVKKSHDIAKSLRNRLEEHPEISKVFVHINPLK